MAIQHGALYGRWLHQILRHMGRAESGTARLGPKLGLDIDALFQQNTFEK